MEHSLFSMGMGHEHGHGALALQHSGRAILGMKWRARHRGRLHGLSMHDDRARPGAEMMRVAPSWRHALALRCGFRRLQTLSR
ncbi:MAG: hypothetical protein CL858_25670 [Cupriavidus sp.]|nr:hypothetical protein [Cupriavidus sp.]